MTKQPELILVSFARSMPRSIAIPAWIDVSPSQKVSRQQYVPSTHLYT